MIAYKFLAAGAVAPFTGFPWPGAGEWVNAPAGHEDRWIYACRGRDLPHWLADELWRVELEEPIREARYQIASPRARLVERIPAWNGALAREYARACALRVRELALPHLEPAVRDPLARAADLADLEAAARGVPGPSAIAGYVGDAARNALHVGPATTSYIACVLAASLRGGLAAFEAERAWQAGWLAERLGLAGPPGAAPAAR